MHFGELKAAAVRRETVWVHDIGEPWQVWSGEVQATAAFPTQRAFIRTADGELKEIGPQQCHATKEASLLAARETVSRKIVEVNRRIDAAKVERDSLYAPYDRLTCELVPGQADYGVGVCDLLGTPAPEF